MIVKALAILLCAAVAFGSWQYVRAERLQGAAETLETCREVQDLKKGAENETDDALADSISGSLGGLW